MPAGVNVVVEDGFATIDFVDGTLRGRGLAKLLEVGTPPEAIEKLTREGPRAVYIVPEGNAREAGLLDEAKPEEPPIDPEMVWPPIDPSSSDPDSAAVAPTSPTPVEPAPAPQAWPDGEPELEWKRPELDAYAASKGLDTKELPNKHEVFAAITKAAEAR
ncbi:hypothetical protein [Mycobacteroides chelonae]|uniref:hypothetical protein n=1 Tax=Mycobacteroides chelonae TaxID=1774 RepID=UPI0008A8BF1D|nr:hypothetical protein [Mycobacteroides chelonae]OHU29027.1 hypothetical protein BKG78_23425 [Mycobacteroides chelonae]